MGLIKNLRRQEKDVFKNKNNKKKSDNKKEKKNGRN